MALASGRSALIDTLKVLAAQLIVLHHIAIYAPMSDALAEAGPRLMDFLADEARMVVQIFLVIGGYLAARSLGRRPRSLMATLAARYWRLVPLLAVALGLVLLASALLPAGRWPAWVTPWPGPGELVAHLLLLQDLLAIPSLSAGAWYVAIDFQLFALLALLVSALGRADRPTHETAVPWLMALLTLASLWIFNRRSELDAWALYFVSAYGLGTLAAWARLSRRAAWLFAAVVALHLVDGLLDPRPRLFIAGATALVLWAFADRPWPAGRLARALGFWSDASYAVFVVHYAVIVAASALWLHGIGRGQALAMTFVTWALALALGALLQRRVAAPLARWKPGSHGLSAR